MQPPELVRSEVRFLLGEICLGMPWHAPDVAPEGAQAARNMDLVTACALALHRPLIQALQNGRFTGKSRIGNDENVTLFLDRVWPHLLPKPGHTLGVIRP